MHELDAMATEVSPARTRDEATVKQGRLILRWLRRWKIQLAIAFAAVFALAILWKVPQWQANKLSDVSSKERFDRENAARTTLAQIIGGIAVLAGFYATVKNIRLSQESFALAQQGQITDRFTKAIEQLGAVDASGKKKLEVRLGGIYALERIAYESERDHWPIIEVLTAYIRDNAPRREQQDLKEPQDLKQSAELQPRPETDIQAILTVLGRRNVHFENGERLNLRHTDLTGAYLYKADFSKANLYASNLSGVFLNGANLSAANLYESNLSRTNIYESNLSGAKLVGADLREAGLGGANLSEADLTSANLRLANLSGANLSGANLSKANLSIAILCESKLTGAVLYESNLTGANLSGAVLRGANLTLAGGVQQQQIDAAIGDNNTELPLNIHIPASWKEQSQAN